ncbi:MAG: hypothetical protein DCC65_03115 [Planctomycetota bacterium]|nr:MAG: hypothetical protein DCC65_03115 [Planctomycetota bacterium]
MRPARQTGTDASLEQVLRALRRVRTRVRLALAVEALAKLIVVLIAGAAVVAAADWLVRFPWFVRVVFLMIASSGTGVWMYRHVIRPLAAPIPLGQLALALDGLPAETRDLLAGALDYVREGGDGSRTLWDRVLNDTAGVAPAVSAARLVNLRRAASAAAGALGLCLCALAVGWFLPWAVSTGIERLVTPLSPAQWPRARQIEPLTGDAVVAFGETFTAEMRLLKGDTPTLRCFLTWESSEGRTETSLMRRDTDGVYRMTLENIRRPVRYSFRAGDDDTSGAPFLLRVARRPEVVRARMFVRPPSYVTQRDPVEESLEDHEAEVMEGAEIRLEARPSKHISGEGLSRAEVVFDDERAVAMRGSGGDWLFAEFAAEKSGTLRVRIVDGFGLESRGGSAYRLIVKPDEPPTVTIGAPASVIEATASAVIDLRVSARDDAGIAGLQLLGGKAGAAHDVVADLLAEAGVGAGAARNVESAFVWNLASLKLAPGEAVEYFVEVRDELVRHGTPRDPVRSAVGRIQIISEARLAERLRMELLLARDQLRRLVGSVRQARQKTTVLDAGPTARIPLTEAQSAEARQLAGEVARLREGAGAGARLLSELSKYAARNGAGDTVTAQKADALSHRLGRQAVTLLGQASEQLSRAAGAADAEGQHEALLASANAQGDVAMALDEMLREMEQWDEYEDMVRRLRDALDRQEGLEREVSQLTRRSGERSLDQLEAVLQQDLLRSGVAQGQLRGETDQLLTSMQTWARQRAETDLAAAASLRDAASVGRQQGVLERMDQAAGAIQTNRLSAASSAQREAAAAMRAILAALDDRPERQLEELSRELRELSARLRRLIETQAALIERNRRSREADDSAVEAELAEQADRQDGLRSTARQTAKLIKPETDDGSAAREAMDAAVGHMGGAADLLSRAEGAEAEESQKSALEELQEALVRVEDMEEQVDRERGERSLDAIVEALNELVVRQKALRAETADIRARRDEQGEFGRADALRLARAARHQRELVPPLTAVREQAAESVVYSYLLEGVAELMNAAAAKLTSLDADGALADQDRIVRDLNRLIDSAKEQRDRKDPRFVQDQGGGGSGGAGQPTARKPVPALAELKVLKSLQTDVAVQTRSLGERLVESAARTEEQRRHVRRLADQQDKIRELAGRMLEQAREDRQ